MKIKDIVEMSAVLLQLEDVLKLDEFTGETSSEQVDELAKKNLDLLVRCANLSLSVLATNKYKLIKNQTFNSNNGEILFEDFSKNVYEVLKVVSNNNDVIYRVYPNMIDCYKKGTYTVTYAYLPSYKNLNDEIDDFDKTVPVRVMAYFVASEFCFISGNFEDASVWEQKFKETLENLTSSKSRKVPERRWF